MSFCIVRPNPFVYVVLLFVVPCTFVTDTADFEMYKVSLVKPLQGRSLVLPKYNYKLID